MDKECQKRMNFPTRGGYLLTKEIKPNGNQFCFSYKTIHDKTYLTQIRVLNRTGRDLLNELNFSYSSKGCMVKNSSRDSVHYIQSEEPCLSKHVAFSDEMDRNVLKKVDSSQKGLSCYRTMKKDGHRKVVKVEKPGKGFIEIEYEEAETHRKEDKVVKLIEPLGVNGESVTSYHFHYQKNLTAVKDALGHFTLYHFDDNQRLASVDYLDQHKHLLRQEDFEWSKKEGQEGWLYAKGLRLKDQFFHLKSYRYDSQGNIIRSTLYGNLTGEKNETFQRNQKKETDHYSLEYAYTDEHNLLKEKKTPEG